MREERKGQGMEAASADHRHGAHAESGSRPLIEHGAPNLHTEAGDLFARIEEASCGIAC
jgi:hypothetical protein